MSRGQLGCSAANLGYLNCFTYGVSCQVGKGGQVYDCLIHKSGGQPSVVKIG